VIGAASTVVGVAKWVFGAQHQPANFWLLLGLALLAVVFAWAWLDERSRRQTLPAGRSEQHFHGSVTIHQHSGAMAGATAPLPTASDRETVGPDAIGRTGPEMVRIAEYVEIRPGSPPIIRNRRFRNVVLVGPILLFLDRVELRDVTWGIPGEDLGVALWPVEEGQTKIGLALVDNCVFDGCVFEAIAVTIRGRA
jgi:hypothetical protein